MHVYTCVSVDGRNQAWSVYVENCIAIINYFLLFSLFTLTGDVSVSKHVYICVTVCMILNVHELYCSTQASSCKF
jgi:hypothetical protein